MMFSAARPSAVAPFWAAVGCFFIWGLFPYLFGASEHAGASAGEVTAWRAVAALPCLIGLLLLAGAGQEAIDVLMAPEKLIPLTASGLLIGVNWTVYVWAVGHGQTLAASLGYYVNPLMIMAVGGLFFRERLGPLGIAAIVLAAAGVAVQAVAVGRLPWVSLVLALSFTGYSLLRKRIAVDVRTGLFVECFVLAVPSLVYIGWAESHGQALFGTRWDITLLLLAGGPATIVPLMLFAYAARRLPLTTVGFLQFITPTMLFGVALLNGERLGLVRAASFGLIWAGVGLFLFGSLARARAVRLAAA
jgi:chloramphenicol-sensitive protein RarD